MIMSIKKWLAPPVFKGDEKKTYRVKLINVLINLAIGFLGLIVIGNLLDSSTPPRNFVIDFTFIGMFLFLRRLLFAGRVKWVGNLIVISAFILIAVGIASEGTVLAPATALFSLLVITSGFIFNLSGIIIATIVSSLVVAGLILAHQAGVLPPPNYTESIFQWFVFTGTFGMTGGVAYFYNQLTDQALERSRMEIREREQVEVELRKLTRAVEQSPASIVITDLNGNIEYVNPRFTQITGYSSDEAIGKNPRILKTDLTPPETHQQLWETLTQGKEWQGEFMNHKKDGALYTESAAISPITDLNGVATHYLAVKEDITGRKQVEESLRLYQVELTMQNEELLRTQLELEATRDRYQDLYDLAPVGYITVSEQGLIIEANLTAAALLGVAHNPLRQSRITKFILREDHDIYYLARKQILETDEPNLLAKSYDLRMVKQDKTTFWSHLDESTVRAADGTLVLHITLTDITERKLAEEALKGVNEQLNFRISEVENLQQELQDQAVHDPLTGLYNRRYLNETLEREIARAERENDPLSIIVSDIDHFKNFNDTYGHSVGDKFLVEIASLMKNHARGSDIVCRYGGEEFLLVLPGTSMDAAVKRTEEIRMRCSEFTIQHEGTDLHTTMSFGVASYPEHGQEADEIIIKADKAMYRSKQAGRNQVTAWVDAGSSE